MFFSPEQTESNRRAFNTTFGRVFSQVFKCDRHGNLQSSLILLLNQGKAAVFTKILFVDFV